MAAATWCYWPPVPAPGSNLLALYEESLPLLILFWEEPTLACPGCFWLSMNELSDLDWSAPVPCGFSTSSHVKSPFGNYRRRFKLLWRYISGVLTAIFFGGSPVAISFFSVFRKFLKEISTPVMLSRVLLATEAFNTSSMLCPHMAWIELLGF